MRHRRTLLPHISCNHQMYLSYISQIYFCRRCIWSSVVNRGCCRSGPVVSICATAGHYYPISPSGGRHASLVRPHSVHHQCHLLQSTKSRSLPFHFWRSKSKNFKTTLQHCSTVWSPQSFATILLLYKDACLQIRFCWRGWLKVIPLDFSLSLTSVKLTIQSQVCWEHFCPYTSYLDLEILATTAGNLNFI